MKGNDQVRHCPECDRNVYNLSAMTEREAEQLIATHVGRLCTRFYQRADGTILTQDCPFGLEAVARRVSRIAGAALSAAMSLGLAAAQTTADRSRQPMIQIDRSETGITINVLDRTGAGIQNATVTLQDELNHVLTGTTDAKGRLRFPSLAPGGYQLTIKAPGFQTYYESRVVGEQREVETAHAETLTVIDQQQIAELPTNQRDLRVVMGLFPSVSHPKPGHAKAAKHSAKSKPSSSSTDQSAR